MEFYEKLDFLMELASITNSKLAKSLNVDSSLLSRWRRGLRLPGNYAAVISQIADELAPRIRYDYKIEALSNISSIPMEYLVESKLRESIVFWLSECSIKGQKSERAYSDNNDLSSINTIEHMKKKNRKDALKVLGKAIDRAEPGGVFRIYVDEPASWADITSQLSGSYVNYIAKFETLKIMFPATISYEELRILWSQIECLIDATVICVAILDRLCNDIFQHTIFIAGDYGLLSSFGFYSCDNITTITSGPKKVILDTVQGFDRTFDDGQKALSFLRDYKIHEDLNLFERIFSNNKSTFYYGSFLNPLFIPPEVFHEIAQRGLDAMGINNKWLENMQKQLFQFIKTNSIYTTIPIFSPEEICMGKACLPNVPRILNGKPMVSHGHYKKILIYTVEIYKKNCNLHLIPLREDVRSTIGLQESNSLNIMKASDYGTVNYYSCHGGIVSTAVRTLEEYFHDFNQKNTRESTLKILQKQIALFD